MIAARRAERGMKKRASGSAMMERGGERGGGTRCRRHAGRTFEGGPLAGGGDSGAHGPRGASSEEPGI